MNVKRKDPLANKKERVKKANDGVRKVSKRVNFEEMYDAFTKDGPLIPLRTDVYFERKKEGKVHVCVGMFHSVYRNGSIDIWDETHQEFWGFNYRTELHLVRCRVPTPPTGAAQETPSEPAVVANPEQDEEVLEALERVATELEDGAEEHCTAQDIEAVLLAAETPEVAAHLKSCDMCATTLDIALQDFQKTRPRSTFREIDVPKIEEKPKEKLKFKLWVDDERDPPDDTWVIARSTQQALELIKMVGGLPHVMSLDHDLGMKPDGKEDKIIHLLVELEQLYEKWPVPEYVVHSQNPVGRANTIAFMEAWKKSRST